MASRHRGESWSLRRRRGGLSQDFPRAQTPLRALSAPSLGSHPGAAALAPARGRTALPPAALAALRGFGRLLGAGGAPRGAWPAQLELERRHEGMNEAKGRGRPLTPSLTLPAALDPPQPGLGDTERTRMGSGWRWGLRGTHASGASGGAGARAALTQAATSRPAAASSSRVGPVPGNSSGLCRLLTQHGQGVGDGPGHRARPRARLRAPGGSDTGPAPGPSFPPRSRPRAPPRASEGPSSGEGTAARPSARRLFPLRDKGPAPPGQGP